ncbi:MAG: hypothetical protein CYPHOPRED_000641, partial [Cyphobasidiales sp. Tagirdzhanova-0007]
EVDAMPEMSFSGANTSLHDDGKHGDSYDTEASKASEEKYGTDSVPYVEESEAVALFKGKLPAIELSNGFGAFAKSVGQRFKAAFTPRLCLCIIIGQILSLCITCTSVVTTELNIGLWSLPATQTFFVYFALMSIYTPITLYKYGFRAWGKMVMTDGWKYMILGTVDVFGNFATVFGFRYTNLLSCLLLGAWSTPVSMIVTFILLKARYHWTQLLGVCVCLAGLGVLITSDYRTDKNWGSTRKVEGDLFILLGATLYGLSNGGEEFLVRGRPHYEVVGMLGFVGFIVNGILAGAYEHASVHEAAWTGRNVGLLVAYISAMVILYTLAPLLFRFASSPFYNLSLMTSDFFSLLFGLFLFHYKPYFLYFIAYPMVVVGLVIYFVSKPPEAHATIAVKARGRQADKEAAAGFSRVIGDPKGGMGSIL